MTNDAEVTQVVCVACSSRSLRTKVTKVYVGMASIYESDGTYLLPVDLGAPDYTDATINCEKCGWTRFVVNWETY